MFQNSIYKIQIGMFLNFTLFIRVTARVECENKSSEVNKKSTKYIAIFSTN